jgi:hypothetical protein
MRAAAGLLLLALAGTTAAPGQEQPAYRDDRSTPEAVIRSFYNAIDRGEYARAYSYYRDGEGVADYRSFAAGYADTASVTVFAGAAASEGAAGSTYFTLPVSLDATDRSGGHHYFAGCYSLRLIQPAIQDPPVIPTHIVSGKLSAARGAGAAFVPTSCGD